jgi:hypothetical protein
MPRKTSDTRRAVRAPASVDAFLSPEEVARQCGPGYGAVRRAINPRDFAAADEVGRQDP